MAGGEIARGRVEGVWHVNDPEATQRQRLAKLGRWELEILGLLAGGSHPKMIARQLCSSPKTVRNQLSSIYGKLDVAGCVEAAVLYRTVHPGE